MVLSGGYGRYVTTGYKTNLRKKKTDYFTIWQFAATNWQSGVVKSPGISYNPTCVKYKHM